MSASAGVYPQEIIPPDFSFGALFGFSKESRPMWKYEPPSSAQNARPMPPGLDATNAPSQSERPPCVVPAASCQADAFALSVQANTPRAGESPPQQQTQNITGGELSNEQCIDLFKSKTSLADDLSNAKRSGFLREVYESCKPLNSKNPWKYNLAVMQYLAERRWDATSVVQSSEHFAVPPAYKTETAALLKYVADLSTSVSRHEAYATVHLEIAKTAARARPSAGAVQDFKLLNILRELWHYTTADDGGLEGMVANTLSAIVDNVHDQLVKDALLAILSRKQDVHDHINLLVSRAADTHSLRDIAIQVLRCIPPTLQRRIFNQIIQNLSDAIKEQNSPTKTAHQHRLESWLYFLDHIETQLFAADSATAPLDEAIANAETLFIHGRNSVQNRVKQLLKVVILRLAVHDTHYASAKDSLLDHVDLVSVSGHGNDWLESARLIASIFMQIQQASLPLRKLVTKTSTFFADTLPSRFMLYYLTALKERKIKMNESVVLHELFVQKMARLKQPGNFISERERQRFAYEVSTCQEVLKALQECSTSTANIGAASMGAHLSQMRSQYQLEHILNRARAAHALPIAYRQIEVDASDETRIMLIHQLAHQYSMDKTLSHREAWRAIYYLYRYLQQNDLPIGPLFTKAIVRVSIARPLSENRFVSARRLIWVCHRVAESEGETEARKIEDLFWVWRGDLIKHSKTMFVLAGGDRREKARIGTMKKLGLI
ncbi:hypothetical protein ACN47E_001516 [Coniothyrium glycines]